MIANNSSGAHCLGYGNTIDFLQEIQVAYSDGSGLLGDKRCTATGEFGDGKKNSILRHQRIHAVTDLMQ